jgi:hypothetical protein
MTIVEGFEFYFPKQPNPVIKTVTRVWTAMVRRYGQMEPVPMAEFVDDWGVREEWAVKELEEYLAKGYIVPNENGVPFKARKRLQSLAVGSLATHIDPKSMVAIEALGRKVFAGVTPWTHSLVGLVDADGKLVRKQTIVDEATEILRQGGFVT